MISIIIQVVERGNTSYLNSCKVSQTSWQRVAQNAVTRKNTIVRCVLSSAQNYLSELKSLAWDVSCQSGLSGSFEISFMWTVAKKGIGTGRRGRNHLDTNKELKIQQIVFFSHIFQFLTLPMPMFLWLFFQKGKAWANNMILTYKTIQLAVWIFPSSLEMVEMQAALEPIKCL